MKAALSRPREVVFAAALLAASVGSLLLQPQAILAFATVQHASDDFSRNVGWHFFTIDEPKPRISVVEAGGGDTIVIRHGYVTMHRLGGRWYDTVQTLSPSANGYDSVYQFSDGRPSLRTSLARQGDGSLLEVFIDSNGVENRNVLEFTGDQMTIKRFRRRANDWVSINITRKDGWSPERREQKRLAEIREQRERDRAAQRELAEQRRMREEELAARAEAREWGRQVDEANRRGAQQILDEMRGAANGPGESIWTDSGSSGGITTKRPTTGSSWSSPSAPGTPQPAKQCSIPGRTIEISWTGMKSQEAETRATLQSQSKSACGGAGAYGGDPTAYLGTIISMTCNDGSCAAQVQCPSRQAPCDSSAVAR